VHPEMQNVGGIYLDHCRIARPSAVARDKAVARQLFTQTEQLLNVKSVV